MNHIRPDLALARQDQFGRRVAARLDAGLSELPHDIAERLRAGRMQALAQRKVASLQATAGHVSIDASGQATLGGPGMPFWQRIVSLVPLLALLAGLVAIDMVQTERRASEVAEVDAALLTDDLPPAAYADPGFVQFLKSGQ